MNRLTHARVWSAIDALARRYGLSASGLAKRAGLDPTSFNESKRVTGEGRPRWPTTESIAKVLDATGATFEDFTQLVTAAARGARGRAQPAASSTMAAFPSVKAGTRSASPRSTTRTPTRSGSPATVCSRSTATGISSSSRPIRRRGEVMAKILLRRTTKTFELASFNPAHPNLVFPVDRIDWMARIVWASQ